MYEVIKIWMLELLFSISIVNLLKYCRVEIEVFSVMGLDSEKDKFNILQSYNLLPK